jgi:hypothetical protein
VFVRLTGSNEEAVDVEPREAGWSIVATDISLRFERCELDRSLALEMRLGTSERIEELIYPSEPSRESFQTGSRTVSVIQGMDYTVTSVVFQNRP